MTHICTVGYEGLPSDEWIELIRTNEIDVVVDVRELPQSRKSGFSKRTLQTTLDQAGVRYVHAKELGNPTKWRKDLDAGLDFSSFAKRFEGLLDEQHETLEDLHSVVVGQRVCLLCYEEDPRMCHRSLVAERLRTMYPDDVEVDHIRHAWR